MTSPTFHDVKLLSAYLDEQLSQADVARLETRLQRDPDLRAVMDDLSQSRALLRKLPQRRAPRNFTLSPEMAGVRAPLPRAVPALAPVAHFVTLLLFLSMAANALAPSSLSQPMAYGMGSGGGSDQTMVMEAAPAVEAPATEAPALDNNGQSMKAIPTEEPRAVEPTQPQKPPAPIPLAWQIVLLVVALSTGGLAYILAELANQSWRKKVK
jgi:anti-sigma factor RsiW